MLWGALANVVVYPVASRRMVDSATPTDVPEWPAHIASVQGCPLPDAAPVDGPIFRRIAGASDDWKSYRELRKIGKNAPAAKHCQSAALSCYRDLNALKQILAVHEAWATQQIVVAHLRPEHGVIKQTGNDPNHHSLWLRSAHHKNCADLFVEVT
jgi:hypothetical protein